MQPSSHYITCLDREIHYVEWGRKDSPPLLMWHGLARTCRDFDDLAMALADTYRIICPDTIGRGLSQWSPEPDAEYHLAFYARIAQALVDQLGIGRLRFVGTSMGGALGMVVGATTLRDRISHLVLNDVGTTLNQSAIDRIKSYVGNPAQFETVTEFEAYMRKIYTPYSAQTDAQWRRMTETSVRRLPDGKITPHYDPAIVRQFFVYPDDYVLGGAYDTLRMPTLVLRGENSDLLSAETAQAMTERGPRARLEVVKGCGHAPCMNVPEQIRVVREFLSE